MTQGIGFRSFIISRRFTVYNPPWSILEHIVGNTAWRQGRPKCCDSSFKSHNDTAWIENSGGDAYVPRESGDDRKAQRSWDEDMTMPGSWDKRRSAAMHIFHSSHLSLENICPTPWAYNNLHRNRTFKNCRYFSKEDMTKPAKLTEPKKLRW